jgi:hypothetical protein
MNINISNYIYATFCFKILNFTEGTKSFLINNPFIYIDKYQLKGLVFLGEDRPINFNDLEELFKKYKIEGLNELSFVSTSGFSKDVETFFPKNYQKRIINDIFFDRKFDIIIINKN